MVADDARSPKSQPAGDALEEVGVILESAARKADHQGWKFWRERMAKNKASRASKDRRRK